MAFIPPLDSLGENPKNSNSKLHSSPSEVANKKTSTIYDCIGRKLMQQEGVDYDSHNIDGYNPNTKLPANSDTHG